MTIQATSCQGTSVTIAMPVLFTTLAIVGLSSHAVAAHASVRQSPSPSSGQVRSSNIRTSDVDRLFQQGKQQLLANQLTAARQTFEQVLQQRRSLKDLPGEAAVLNELGELYPSLQQFDRARVVLEQALRIWRRLHDRSGEAAALTALGALDHVQEHYPQALEQLQQALTLQQSLDDAIAVAKTLVEWGSVLIDQGDAAAGLERLQQGQTALQAATSDAAQQRIQQGRLLGWIGFGQLVAKQPETALKSLESALVLNREAGDRQMEGVTLFFTGIWYAQHKQIDRALELYQQSLAIYAPSGDRAMVGTLQSTIATAHSQLKQYPQAIAAYQRAIAAQRETGNSTEQAKGWVSLGNTYAADNQFTESRRAFEQAIAIVKTLPNPTLEREILNRVAQGYRQQGIALKEAGATSDATIALQRANTTYQQVYRLAQQMHDRLAEGWALLAIGLTHVAQGQNLTSAGAYREALTTFQQAIEPLQQAQTLARSLTNRNLDYLTISQLSLAFAGRATAFSQTSHWAEALQAEQQALAIVRENRDRLPPKEFLNFEAGSLGQIGLYLEKLGQTAQAVESYQAALASQRQLGDHRDREVNLLGALATASNTLGQTSQALEAAQHALTLVQQQGQDPQQEGLLRTTIGNYLQAMGRFPAAVQSHEQALAIAKRLGDRPLESSSLDNLGTVYDEQGQYQRALEYHQQAFDLTEHVLQQIEAGDEPTLKQFCRDDAATHQAGFDRDVCLDTARAKKASALNNLAGSYTHLGRYAEALKLRQEALTIATRLGDRNREASLRNNIGYIYLQTGDYPQALAQFQQALALVTAQGDRRHQSQILANIGMVYVEQGQYTQSLEYRQKALAIVQLLQAPSVEANILDTIGTTYAYLGEHQRALTYFQRSLKLSESLGIQPTIELGNLGFFYENQGDVAKARAAYQQVLRLAQENGDRLNEAVALGKLATLDWSQGRYAQSLQTRQQAQAIYQAMGDRPNQAAGLLRLGTSYRILGQPDRALELLQQALTLSRAMEIRRTEATVLNQIGMVYQDQTQYTEALAQQRQALAIQQDMQERLSVSDTLVSIGSNLVQQQQLPEAIASFQKALHIQQQIGVRPHQAKTLRELGVAYAKQGQVAQAIAMLQQALAMQRDVEDHEQEGITLSALGEILLNNHQPQAAETALAKAAKILDALRLGLSDRETVSLFETQTNTYRLWQQALIAQTKPEAALEVAERGRARAFVTLLSQRLHTTVNSTANSTANSTKATSASEIQPPTLAKIREIAKAHQATLVEYSIVNDQLLYIWVVQPSGAIAFRQVNLHELPQSQRSQASVSASPAKRAAQSLAAPVDRLLTSIRRGVGVVGAVGKPTPPSPQSPTWVVDSGAIDSQLRQWHQQLIAPIANLLPADPQQRVVFIPQGPLFLVPFAALRDGNDRYLVEQHALLSAPSIQVLDLTRQQRDAIASAPASQPSPLIVGNPTMPKVSLQAGSPAVSLPALPGAAAEANAIAEFFHTSFLTGAQATKSTVLQHMRQSRLIHLATHGLLDEQNGIHSAIALAPSATDDGLLTADEILNLHLRAELVVLSACDTGRGKVTGDGVIGLSRSLISAGVPSVVVSLWSVPDAPTAELMIAFYRSLQHTPDKAQALRQAMIKTMQQHPNPIDWAAFTLIGEAQ